MFCISKETVEIHRRMKEMPMVQQFLSSKARRTVYENHGYKTSLAYLYQFLDAKYGTLTLETITDSIIHKNIDVYKFLDEFVGYLHSKKLSQGSRNQYLTCVKSYLQYHDVDIVPHKFKMRVTLPRIPQEDELAIDQNDIRTILLQCHSQRSKTFILVLASSGVRVIEACALRFCDIYFDESPTRIHIRAKYTKTKRDRDIYISDEASKFLREWIEHRLEITLDETTKISKQTSESLVFQVCKANNRKVEPKTIYNKLVQQFQTLLDEINLGQRKDGMARRKITFHSFRRFVKTTISDSPAGGDYSEWFIGHTKSSYWVKKAVEKAEKYSTYCMNLLSFLDYSTIKAHGKNIEARLEQVEKEKQMMNQKHEQEIQELRVETDRKLNEIIMIIQKNLKLARLKPEVLKTRPLKRK